MKPYTLPYSEIPGAMSSRSLAEHYKLYTGYIETAEQSKICSNKPQSGMSKSVHWALKNAESYAMGGVVLHELFFKNLIPNARPKIGNISIALQKKWGSVQAWAMDFRAAAESGRGWAMLGCCPLDPLDLHNIVLDAHDNAPPGYEPLLVIDLYEHAYWLDHPNQKSRYLDGVFRAINWDEINDRYLKLGLSAMARR